MENDIKYKFELLKEQASGEDLLGDKTHEGIANTIYGLLSNNNDDGTTIGLEGGWGSGKSTVVSLLTKKLDDNENDILYFYFDAWAHEGDPLRRIFLESLIERAKQYKPSSAASLKFLSGIKEVFSFLDCMFGKDMRLESLEAKVSNRLKTIKTHSENTITGLGKIMGIAALLVPVGVSILSSLEYPLDFSSLSLWNWNGQPHTLFWVFVVSLAMGFAPLLVVFIAYAANGFDLSKLKFLEGESESEAVQEILEGEDRSSIEFERYFKEILEVLLPEGSRNKLLIIVDNLDRIEAGDSLKIWSTLQTFLQHRNLPEASSNIYKNLWILVPYDQDGLSKLWDPVKSKNKDQNIAQSFFDKCFQIRLEVPRLILSGWEDFLRKQIDEALIEGWDDDKDDIVKMLALTRASVNDIPTPRQIKTYINQVALLSVTHEKTDVSIKAIAYYAVQKYLKSKSAKEIEGSLINPQLLEDSADKQILSSEGFKAEIAGILFGVTAQKGQELLLEPEIERALKAKDPDTLKKLLNNHGEAFWIVFSHHLPKMAGLETMLNYSITVNESLWNDHPTRCSEFLDYLSSFAQELENVNLPNRDDLERYKAMFTLLSKSKYSFSKMWKSIVKSFSQLYKDDQVSAGNGADVLFALASCIEGRFETVTVAKLPLPKWIEWEKATRSVPADPDTLVAEFQFRTSTFLIKPEDSFCEQIADTVIPGQPLQEGLGNLISYLIKVGFINWEQWNSVTDKIQQYINANSGQITNGVPTIKIFEILNSLSKINKKCSKLILPLLQQGSFYNLTYNLQNQGSVKYAALLTLKILPDNYSLAGITAVANSQAGINMIDSYWKKHDENDAKFIWQELSKINRYDLIWKLAKDEANVLIGDVIKFATNEGNNDLFILEDSLNNMHNALRFSGKDEPKLKAKLAKAFLENSNIEKDTINQRELDLVKYRHALYRITQNTENESFYSWLSENLKALSEKDWEEAIETNRYLILLAVVLKERFPSFELTNSFHNALRSYYESWISGTTINDEELKPPKELINLLSPDFQQHLKDNLSRKLISIKFASSLDAINKLKEFFNYTKIATEGRDTLQESIEEALVQQSWSTLNAINSIIEYCAPLKIQWEKKMKNILKEPFRNLFREDLTESQIALIESLAEYFNIPLDDIKQEEQAKEQPT